MENVPGSFGTGFSFALRSGQIFGSSTLLIFMCLHYDSYDFNTFCYLTTLVAFVTPWSILLALADAYSLLLEKLPHKPSVISMVLACDVVLSFLCLGGASGVASATELLSSTGAQRHICGDNLCSHYLATATLVFLCCLLLLASALVNLWSLPSLLY